MTFSAFTELRTRFPILSFPVFQLVVVLIAAFCLRLLHVESSFWLDEAAQAIESTRPWSQQLVLQEDFQPPLFHLWLFLFGQLSHSEAWLRMASIIPGVASIFCVWHVLRLRLHEQAAWKATVLLSLSSLHGFFSQELRPYMFAVFWATLSWWALETLLVSPKARWARIGLPVALAGGVLSSYVFVFWVFGLWVVSMIVQPTLRKRVTASAAWAGGASLIWFPWFVQQWRVGQALRETLPGWESVVSAPALKAVLLVLSKFLVGVLEIDLNWHDMVLVGGWYILVALAILFEWRRNSVVRWWSSLFGVVLLSAWLVTVATPVLAPKRILFLLPVLLALVAALCHSRQAVTRWLATTAVVWFVAVQMWGWVQYGRMPERYREDWRGLSQDISAVFSPSRTGVIFAFDGPFAPWRWYVGTRYVTLNTGLAPITQQSQAETQLAVFLQQSPGLTEILLFDYLRDLTDPYGLIPEALVAYGYTEVTVYERPLIGQVHVYRRTELFAQRK